MEISPQQWTRVKELYEAALECPRTERESFLQTNSEDDVIRQEVDRLLKERDTLSFLSTPVFMNSRLAQTLPKHLAPGDLVYERFRILNFIAAGGMGEVYKAEDLRLDRVVALKFLPNELAEDRQSLDRFRREAKAASALNHPNICTVYDLGDDMGRAFIAMEFLEGETLSARIRKGPIPLDEFFPIAIALASALGAAHERGIIHRDLKPGNIMLTERGAILLDFGLARYEQPATTETETSTFVSMKQVVGTPPYMSPEQLQGKEVDARTDCFAFGAVLYEMLTGKKAFERRSITAENFEEPRVIHEFIKDVPADLERIVQKCLRRRPEERFAFMSEIERELQNCSAFISEPASGINLAVLLRQSRRPRIAVPLVLTVLILIALVAGWIRHNSKANSARKTLPQIERLIDAQKFDRAFALAVQAQRAIPNDAMLAKLWDSMSWSAEIDTAPSGASVYWKNYNSPDTAWELVGRTPIRNRRFPYGSLEWKFELKGYTTIQHATFRSEPVSVTLPRENETPADMVRVELQNDPVPLHGITGSEALPALSLSDFWIDKFEVSNAAFKRFIDDGGYEKKEFWKFDFRKDGRSLSWADAMKLFHDRTGLSGPANWVQGKYPQGQDNYPVTGVSWFEAAAYAQFAGKMLPTIYHWSAAASPTGGRSIIPASNFSGTGPARVGEYKGVSKFGAFDMAGNAKEWVANEASSGRRYIMGGAWDEPTYTFYDADAREPFERRADFGFRCVKYVAAAEELKAAAPVTFQVRDYDAEKPASDEIFNVYKSFYSYDMKPLRPEVELVQQTDAWTEEKVSFDAAYGSERITAFLFIPKRASPPFQTVLHFNGENAFYERSSAELFTEYAPDFDFIIKSGRAVMFPVYKGMFERWDDFAFPAAEGSFRDHVIYWSKDLGRSIDYLETRPDIDHQKLAYHGVSLGAALGAIFPAVEDRLKVLILVSPGFYLYKRPKEADQINFAPRVKAPTLMLNGRFDFYFPVGPSQDPMFRLLGTPREQKRRVLYDTGHGLPRDEVIKETLNWLDRYLGPVK